MTLAEYRDALVDVLLWAADLAIQGYTSPLARLHFDHAGDSSTLDMLGAARYEALAVSRRAFDYRGELLAETLLEAAYRVAEGRGSAEP